MNGFCKMKWVALVLLSVFSVGQSVPVDNCEILLTPITVSHAEPGKWLYVGGTSNIPGSRSFIHLQRVWIESRLTSQSNVLEIIRSERMSGFGKELETSCRDPFHGVIQIHTFQTFSQRFIDSQSGWLGGEPTVFVTLTLDELPGPSSSSSLWVGKCSTLKYNLTVENSTSVIEQPFYLKGVYLPALCFNCFTLYETIISGNDIFTSLLLFSRTGTVPAPALEMLKKQAECLKMPSPIMVNPNIEMCPEDPAPLDGLTAINSYLKAKREHHVIRELDKIIDLLVN